MKFWFGTPGWGWRLWGVSNGDKWFIGLSVKQGASHDSENVAEIEALRAEVERLRRLVQERDAMLGKRLCAGTNADGKPRCLALAEEHARAERLRAEVAEMREFRDNLANAIGNDQLRRFIEKHGEPVPLTIRMQAAEARAERLEAEVERLRAEVARLEVIAGYGGVSSDAPERLILASEVYDGVQSCDKWCDVRRVVDDGQPMPESATAYVRADRAERLEAEVERVTCELMDAITRADKLAEALRELVDVFSESGMYDDEVFAKARAALGQEDDQ